MGAFRSDSTDCESHLQLDLQEKRDEDPSIVLESRKTETRRKRGMPIRHSYQGSSRQS